MNSCTSACDIAGPEVDLKSASPSVPFAIPSHGLLMTGVGRWGWGWGDGGVGGVGSGGGGGIWDGTGKALRDLPVCQAFSEFPRR